MAIFKCKMCGGDLNIQDGITVCECEYCFTKQTIPSLDNEKKLNLFNRANRLRLNSEFDKAANIYESIIAEFPEEAEGYWGLVLCNYGIEYVDDPATARKIPTCHRAAFESVANDENYKLAIEYADIVSQKVYRDEAREIDRIMSEILNISKNEKPYDIFICYKETDMSGGRTIDSVIAQDVYDALTDKGYRVFFSRISLEDKIGKQFEPYIFAALNSAKVMLAFGTKYEYFQAVWVKNEWSRFLKLMARDKSKTLVPCYKDMDAYDMPDEFKALQAQDMGKVGAVQDLLRGIEKLIVRDTKPVVEFTPGSDGSALVTRGYIYLEDADFSKADMYFDKALDENPMSADAYIGKVLAKLRLTKFSDFKSCKLPADAVKDFDRAVRFSQGELKEQLTAIKETIDKIDLYKSLHKGLVALLKKKEKAEGIYVNALEEKQRISTYRDVYEIERALNKAIALFESIGWYKDSLNQISECQELKLSRAYEIAVEIRQSADKYMDESIYTKAITAFEKVRGYKDSDEQIAYCTQQLAVVHKEAIYKKARYHYEKGDSFSLETAIPLFEKIVDWKDSRVLREDCVNRLAIAKSQEYNQNAVYDREYNHAVELLRKNDVASIKMALDILARIPDWKDSQKLITTYRNYLASVESQQPVRAPQRPVHAVPPVYTSNSANQQTSSQYHEQSLIYQRRSQGLCQHCGGAFKKGLFSTKCSNCGKPKDY